MRWSWVAAVTWLLALWLCITAYQSTDFVTRSDIDEAPSRAEKMLDDAAALLDKAETLR